MEKWKGSKEENYPLRERGWRVAQSDVVGYGRTIWQGINVRVRSLEASSPPVQKAYRPDIKERK